MWQKQQGAKSSGQKEIAAAIVEKEADYILALKGNQGTLSDQVQESFRFLPVGSVAQENDLGHGRVEKRTCSVIRDLSLIEGKDQWGGLNSLIKIESERYNKTTTETEKETRYFISSLLLSAQYLNGYVRGHWGVENSLHWSLDVSFNEDHSRKRAGYAAENFSRLNRISLNASALTLAPLKKTLIKFLPNIVILKIAIMKLTIKMFNIQGIINAGHSKWP